MQLSWFVVVNSEQTVLAVFGSALRAEAEDFARRIDEMGHCAQREHGTLPCDHYAWLHSVVGKRPSVGSQFTSVTA